MSNDGELREFLKKKGTLELIIVFSGSGGQFSDGDGKTSISHDTVAGRVGEGEDLGVFKKEISNKGNQIYKLDTKGRIIYKKLDEVNAVEKFYQLVKMREEFEHKCESIDELFSEDGELIVEKDEFVQPLVDLDDSEPPESTKTVDVSGNQDEYNSEENNE